MNAKDTARQIAEESGGGESPRRFPLWEHILPENENACPNCGSVRNAVYKTEPMSDRTIFRKHRCHNCGVVVKRIRTVRDVDYDAFNASATAGD